MRVENKSRRYDCIIPRASRLDKQEEAVVKRTHNVKLVQRNMTPQEVAIRLEEMILRLPHPEEIIGVPVFLYVQYEILIANAKDIVIDMKGVVNGKIKRNAG
jgi:hypothetical protein